jgi:hypothetical protein
MVLAWGWHGHGVGMWHGVSMGMGLGLAWGRMGLASGMGMGLAWGRMGLGLALAWGMGSHVAWGWGWHGKAQGIEGMGRMPHGAAWGRWGWTCSLQGPSSLSSPLESGIIFGIIARRTANHHWLDVGHRDKKRPAPDQTTACSPIPAARWQRIWI